jgi:hypothetical protein
LTESALEFEPVGVGVEVGVGVGVAVGEGLGDGEGDGDGDGDGDGLGEGENVGDGLCADAGMVSAGISASEIAAASAAETTKLRVNFAIVSARTACRWDHCRHRQAA